MTHPIEAALKRKKRPSGRGRNIVLTGLRNVTEVQDPSHNEEKASAAPKRGKGAEVLDGILGEAHRGGPDYVSPQKKKEDQQKKEEYDRRHGRIAEARKAAPSPQPLEKSTIPTDLQNIEVLQKLNQNLKKGTASRSDSTGGRENEYDPNDPLLPRSSRLNNIPNKPPTAQSKVSCRVRFCDHQDFHIDWDAVDPDNRLGSWTSRLAKYFDTAADHEDHKECDPPNLVERSKIMTRRILQKFMDIEDDKLSIEDKRQGKMPRRAPSSSAVEREVNFGMLHVLKGSQTDQLVEKREQATAMNTNAQGNFVQGNRLSGFKPGDNGFAEPEKPRRVTKDPKKPQETAKPKAVEIPKPKITMKRMPKPKHNTESKPKAHEMTAEERALLAGMKQAAAVELEKTIEAEHTAELEKQQEGVESVASKDQGVINWLHGSPTASKPPLKSLAKKLVDKKVAKAANDLPATDKGKRKLSTSSVASNNSESSDGLTQAVNDALDTPFSPESIQTMAKSKSKERMLKLPPKPIKKVKRKASADEDEEDQPKKKKGRKEYKSAAIVTASDDEDGDELISIGSDLSVEDPMATKESTKEVATKKATKVTESTKVTETVDSVTTTELSAPPKKRKLGDSTTADNTLPSTKKVKLTLETSEEATTPRSPPRKSPRRKTPSPLLSPFSTSSKRKTLAEQDEDEAVSPLSQPRSTPSHEPAQTTPISTPESTGSRKRKTMVDDEKEDALSQRSPLQKKAKIALGVVSPNERPRKMSIEYITDAQNNATEEDDQAKVMDDTAEATGKSSIFDPLPDATHEVELNGSTEVDGDGDKDEDQDREIDTFSVPDSDDSLFNDTG